MDGGSEAATNFIAILSFKSLLLFRFNFERSPSCLKVIGGVGWVANHAMANDILSVSPSPLGTWVFEPYGNWLGSSWGKAWGVLGSGLDNINKFNLLQKGDIQK